MRGILTILFLLISNSFMTLAWYGHLRFKTNSWLPSLGFFGIILISWSIAFFEYCFQVPANRIGFNEFGGPFNLIQLKVIQEVISLSVFALFTIVFFKTQTFNYNHLIAFCLLIGAVYFMFKWYFLTLQPPRKSVTRYLWGWIKRGFSRLAKREKAEFTKCKWALFERA